MNTFKPLLLDHLTAHLPVAKEQIETLLSIPPDTRKGHFAMPCFVLAKELRKNPKAIAEELASQIPLTDWLAKIEAVNGYLNFFLDAKTLHQSILKAIANEAAQYGESHANGKTVVVDYSSPNIGKQLAFHHLRSTMIGNCLYRSYKAAGWRAIGVNHLGDWGTQFGKLIVMFRRYFGGDDLEAGKKLTLEDLNKMYVEFGHLAKEEPQLEDQARSAFASMEAGDSSTLAVWNIFREITLAELHNLYEMMNVEFDFYTGEAFFNDKLDGVIALLTEKKLLTESQEREVVMLDDADMPPCLIRKSDGSSLYATRDLAAALYRKSEFNFDRCLYVVDNGQSLHFKQVFKVLEKCDYQWSTQMAHIPFGLILHWNEAEQKWSKGSSKMGNSNTLREVFDAASEKILAFIDEKNPELDDKEQIARAIGIGALVFNDLKNKRLMDVKFDWDSALSFEGDTGPYVQNAHVRLCSILRKAEKEPQIEKVNWEHFSDESSNELILLLSHLPARIVQVTESDEPYHLTQYALNIAEAAHRFIHHNRVLGSEEEDSRLFLVKCTQQVLENTLNLIGVKPIRFM